MADALCSFFLIVAIGVVARQSIGKIIDPAALRQAINTAVLYILVPAFLFAAVCRIDMAELSWQPLAVLGACALGCIILGMFAYGFFKCDQQTKASLILACAFGNVALFGLPAFAATLGEGDGDRFPLAAAAMTACTVVVGSIAAGWYAGSGKNSFAFIRSLGALLRLPPVWALCAGGVIKYYEVDTPWWVLQGADLLTAAMAGLLILSVGLSLRLPQTNEIGLLLPAVAVKLFLAPLLFFLAVRVLGDGAGSVPGPALAVVGALPTQLLVLAVSDRFKLDTALVALVIAVNTALCYWTIPLIYGLLYS